MEKSAAKFQLNDFNRFWVVKSNIDRQWSFYFRLMILKVWYYLIIACIALRGKPPSLHSLSWSTNEWRLLHKAANYRSRFKDVELGGGVNISRPRLKASPLHSPNSYSYFRIGVLGGHLTAFGVFFSFQIAGEYGRGRDLPSFSL